MSKKISIIIPVYNGEKYISECVESIQHQSYQNFEILLIDDGSSDCTLQIAQSLASKDSRIKLLASSHLGVSSARNKGLDCATGEFIFFIDSDDVIHPMLLETLLLSLQNSDAQMAATEGIPVPEESWGQVQERIQTAGNRIGTYKYLSNEEAVSAMFTATSPLSLMGGVMMTHDLIGSTRFRTDLSIGEDFYFIYQTLIKGTSVQFLKQKWYYNRHHKTNSSWNYDYEAFVSRFIRRELIWKSEETFGRFENVKRQKLDAFGCFIRCIRENKSFSNDSKKMRKFIKEYKHELMPAFSILKKIQFYLTVYIPIIK